MGLKAFSKYTRAHDGTKTCLYMLEFIFSLKFNSVKSDHIWDVLCLSVSESNNENG